MIFSKRQHLFLSAYNLRILSLVGSLITLFGIYGTTGLWAEGKYPGSSYLVQGREKELIDSLKELIRKNPNAAQNYIALGSVYQETTNYPEALKYFKEAVRINPNDSRSYVGLGWVYFDIDNYKEAIKYLKEAIRINPNDSSGYAELGWVYSSTLNHSEAIKYLQEAIRINPKDIQGYYGLGRAYLRIGDYREATKCFSEIIRLDPDDAKGYDGLGMVYSSMDNYQEALKWLKEAIKRPLHSNYACPYQGLGNVYKKIGKPRLAEESFINGVKIDPYRFIGYYSLAEYYYEIGRLEQAGENIEKALRLARRDAHKRQALALKGFILIMKQDYAVAEEIFDSLIKKYGVDSYTLAGLGHICNARKEYKQARVYFQESLKISGKSFVISTLGLGWVNANEHKHRQAIICYRGLLKASPLNILGLLGMGNAYNWLGEYDEAEKYFNRALEIDSNNEYALAALGTVYLNRQATKKAEELFEKSLKINQTTYSCPYEGLGLVYLKQNKLKEAEENFRKAIAVNPEIEYKKYNGLAKIYIQKGRLREAKALLQKSIRNYPYDNEAREMLKERAGK